MATKLDQGDLLNSAFMIHLAFVFERFYSAKFVYYILNKLASNEILYYSDNSCNRNFFILNVFH
jgi:hypothetical protein